MHDSRLNVLFITIYFAATSKVPHKPREDDQVKKGILLALDMLSVASCSQQYPEASRKFRVDSGELLIDYREFNYVYARVEALQRTNLEPAPTCYVLFPRYKLTEAISNNTRSRPWIGMSGIVMKLIMLSSIARSAGLQLTSSFKSPR